jgi:hypothetical protein
MTTTVDLLLVKIMSSLTLPGEDIKFISKKDFKVLHNLSQSVTNSSFITESQSKLLLKILKIYIKQFSKFSEELETALKNPTWSKPFRPIFETKKIYSETDEYGSLLLVIESQYSSENRKIFAKLDAKVKLLTKATNKKQQYCSMNEKNLVAVVEHLQDYKFDIRADLLDHYNTIKSWEKSDFSANFAIDRFDNKRFSEKFLEELPLEFVNETLMMDRSLRYQLFSNFSEKNDQNLTNLIATRENSHFWINSQKHSIIDTLSSLIELRRFPVMIVFDSYDAARCLENLKNLNQSLEKLGIFDDIGIYFRLENTEIGKEFNQLIAQKQYNKQLNKHTKVVGVQSGKIPKFFLKNNWTPMSVISLCNHLNNNKTAVFLESCDLVAMYTDKEPLENLRFIKWLSS